MLEDAIPGLLLESVMMTLTSPQTYSVARFNFKVCCIYSDQYERHYNVGSSKSHIKLAETWKNREMRTV